MGTIPVSQEVEVRVWGRSSWVLSSPGSIFTIFNATRSPFTLSRAL